jgi:signal peptide peptidase SppA
MKELFFDRAAFYDVPYVDQWTSAWLIEPDCLNGLVQWVQSIDLQSHVDQMRASRREMATGYSYTEVSNGTAVVQLRGTLMKQQASMSLATSTVMARRDLRALADDETVERVALVIESPGGTAAGTMELGQDVAKLNAQKPVTAFIEDLGASAAYWVASQASKVYANPMAKVGSIGTYAVVQDCSAAAAQAGVKVHVVKAGDFKGAGAMGTEVTSEHLQEVQRLVTGLNEGFLSAVASGRNMPIERVRTLADGRVHLAAEAKAMGLIDGVMGLDELMETITPKPTSTRRKKPMSEKQAATASEIKAACPGISSEKAFEFIESSLSVEDCKSFYMEDLQTKNAELQEQVATLTKERDEAKEQAKKAAKAPGVEELEETHGSEPQGSATDAFNAIVEEKTKAFSGNRAKAMAAAVRENPELHQRMLEEANA